MRFEQPLIEGTLIGRERRFSANVKLNSGEELMVHCAHPGSMMGLSEPGSKVLISKHDDPKRRFQHQLEIIYAGRTPVGIHTGRTSTVVTEEVMAGRISELAGYATMRQNARYNRGQRVDLLLEGNGLRSCYITVKNVTLAHENIAYFPDVQAPQEIDELQELTDIVREGNRAMIIFVAQRADVNEFRPADHIDAEYGQAFRDAVARGVEALCFRAKVSRKGIEVENELKVEING